MKITIEQAIAQLHAILVIETGDKDPLIKIQVSPKTWDVMLGKMHDKCNWVDDGVKIELFEIFGIGIIK